MPLLKRVFGRIGDWLATVGWGKFALGAILLLAAAGIATNVLYDEGPVVVIDRKAPKEKRQGLRSRSGRRSVSNAPAYRSRLLHRRRPRAMSAWRFDASKGASSGSIDEHGLRILSQRNGKPVQVVIDSDGIRVEDAATAPPPVEETPAVVIERSGAVVIPPELAADPTRSNWRWRVRARRSRASFRTR